MKKRKPPILLGQSVEILVTDIIAVGGTRRLPCHLFECMNTHECSAELEVTRVYLENYSNAHKDISVKPGEACSLNRRSFHPSFTASYLSHPSPNR